jgi:hypothetical protein
VKVMEFYLGLYVLTQLYFGGECGQEYPLMLLTLGVLRNDKHSLSETTGSACSWSLTMLYFKLFLRII